MRNTQSKHTKILKEENGKNVLKQLKQHQKFLDTGLHNELFGCDTKSIENKSKKETGGITSN